jgi:hypothetical protein
VIGIYVEGLYVGVIAKVISDTAQGQRRLTRRGFAVYKGDFSEAEAAVEEAVYSVAAR